MVALSLHADYRCGRTGQCCRTPWDVPVEAMPFDRMAAGVRAGLLPVEQPFAADAPAPGYAAMLRREADGACACLDRSTQLCRVHGVLGAPALPVACRLFPRIARTDPWGTVVTLSHYCPTAARTLLRGDVPLAVVEAPEAFPPGDYDGLVADDLPPMLTPQVLMGCAEYAGWEAHAVAVCASAGTVWAALATLARDAERMRTWRPGGTTLLAHLHDIAMDGLVAAATPPEPAWVWERWREVMEAVPLDLQRSPLLDRFRSRPGAGLHAAPDPLAKCHGPALGYVAAHALGNWCAYQGQGVRTYVRSLEAAAAVLVTLAARQADEVSGDGGQAFITAVRDADLLLRHLASAEALARVWSQREASPGSAPGMRYSPRKVSADPAAVKPTGVPPTEPLTE